MRNQAVSCEKNTVSITFCDVVESLDSGEDSDFLVVVPGTEIEEFDPTALAVVDVDFSWLEDRSGTPAPSHNLFLPESFAVV